MTAVLLSIVAFIIGFFLGKKKTNIHIGVNQEITQNYNDDYRSDDDFKRVLNTLKENKVMVQTRLDGIYIRMAGDKSKGQCFTTEWAKVKSFEK